MPIPELPKPEAKPQQTDKDISAIISQFLNQVAEEEEHSCGSGCEHKHR